MFSCFKPFMIVSQKLPFKMLSQCVLKEQIENSYKKFLKITSILDMRFSQL